jgi:hypothetical protein
LKTVSSMRSRLTLPVLTLPPAALVEKSRRSGGLVVSRSNPDSGVFSYRLRYKVKYAF